MNIRFSAVFLAMVPAAAFSVSAALTDGLVAYYSFNTNNGNIVYDQSGHGHNATVYGATYSANGRIGGAFHYDGTNDYILIGDLGYQGQGTISFWMYADAIENWRNPFTTDYASWDDCLRFEEAASGDFGVGLGPILGGASFTTGLQPATWFHVTFAWTTNAYWGWLNGQPVFSGTHKNQLYLGFPNVALGNGYSTDPNRYWKGLVDEVRIYNRVLSGAEVAELAGLSGLSDGLVLYYSFDTNSGSAVYDQSGWGHNGVVSGATYSAAGRCGGAYQFDGINDEIVVPGDLALSPTGELTVALWFKKGGRGTGNETMIQKGPQNHSNSGTCQLSYLMDSRAGKVTFSAQTTGNGRWTDYMTDSVISSGVWHHAAGTYRNGALNLYIDGSPARATENVTGSLLQFLAGPWTIGAGHSFVPSEYFNGLIDEVRIYNRALSAAEVADLAGQSSSPPGGLGTALYYSFNSNNGSVVLDQSGNAHTGSVNGATWTPSGWSGGAYSFDGNDWISAGDIFDLGGTLTQLTVCAWVKCPVPLTTGGIICKQQGTSPYTGWVLVDKPWQFAASQIIAQQPQNATAQGIEMVCDQQWHFVCAAYRISSNHLQTILYVDGRRDSAGDWTGPYGSTDTASPLCIGRRTPGGVDPFIGVIDEVRVYTRLLTAEEILALYGQESGGSNLHITTVGFSDDPAGDQDVTEFIKGETIYIRVRDVDMDSARNTSTARAVLTQRNGKKQLRENVTLHAQADGSFLGSCSLTRFQAGAVDISVYANGRASQKLARDSFITIH